MSIRRTEIQKAVDKLDDLRSCTQMSSAKLAELPEKWRRVWITTPLTEIIELLEAEIEISMKKERREVNASNEPS